MPKFTLLFLMQYYPKDRKEHICFGNAKNRMDTEIAEFFRNAEPQVSQQILNDIYHRASEAATHVKR
jgi:hypothetical protein